MACGINPRAATSKCEVQAGDTVEFEWRVDPGIPAAEYPLKDGSIPIGVVDDSHRGPCAVYAKKVDNSLTAEGAGDGWFKIMEDGVDSEGTFCTTRLRLAVAHQTARIPTSIEPGDYLLRADFLTLNSASPNPPHGLSQPQYYPNCIAVTVVGSSGTATPDTVSIPGYVNIRTPGLVYDIWERSTYEGYPSIGPPLFVDGTDSIEEPVEGSPTSTVEAATSSEAAHDDETSHDDEIPHDDETGHDEEIVTVIVTQTTTRKSWKDGPKTPKGGFEPTPTAEAVKDEPTADPKPSIAKSFEFFGGHVAKAQATPNSFEEEPIWSPSVSIEVFPVVTYYPSPPGTEITPYSEPTATPSVQPTTLESKVRTRTRKAKCTTAGTAIPEGYVPKHRRGHRMRKRW